ncbi:MAG: helix-turn-helix domain-containing protein [Oscillospiraceae bacterium]|nr:helix-turn-helix domain-containing protein [Oscillospiraceae bacterium]
MTIGERISDLRRNRGLTQEQLGDAVGVSAQAVSKWENGGTPDVMLLPILADKLGVTIDELFGRSAHDSKPMSDTIKDYLSSIPGDKRLYELFSLSLAMFSGLEPIANFIDDADKTVFQIRPSAYANVGFGDDISWLRTVVADDSGIMLSIFAEDCPMTLILPEPECGYKHNLATEEEYTKLFAALGRKNAMKVVLWLASGDSAGDNYIHASTVSHGVGISQDEAEEILSDLESAGLLGAMNIGYESKTIRAYSLNDYCGLVPFLYLARWILLRNSAVYCAICNRKKPYLENI